MTHTLLVHTVGTPLAQTILRRHAWEGGRDDGRVDKKGEVVQQRGNKEGTKEKGGKGWKGVRKGRWTKREVGRWTGNKGRDQGREG